MQCTAFTTSQVALGLVSLASFPLAWAFSVSHMKAKSWCFSDECIGGALTEPIRMTLQIYFTFLTLSAFSALVAKHSKVAKRLVSKRPFAGSTIVLGEVVWFSAAMALVWIVLPALTWNFWWNRKVGSNGTFSVRNVIRTILMISGDCLAVLMGLVMLPVAKNSFLATFFDLPYTSLFRIHIWLGRSMFTMATLHLFGLVFGKPRSWNELYRKMLLLPTNAVYGHGSYQAWDGTMIYLVFLVVIVTSLDYVRRRLYNIFFYTHALVFVIVVGAYIHASSNLFYILPGLVMYTLDGCLRLRARFTKETVETILLEECGYISVTVRTRQAAHAKPGHFMRVCFPAVSAFEFHPWTLASVTTDSATFLFSADPAHPREWSARVASLLREHAVACANGRGTGTVEVCLQGPFGREVAVAAPGLQDVIVFYVGGTGVATVIRALEGVLARNRADKSGKQTRVFLFWSSQWGSIVELSLIRDWIDENSENTFVVELFATRGEDARGVEETPLLFGAEAYRSYGAVQGSSTPVGVRRLMFDDDEDEEEDIVEDTTSECSEIEATRCRASEETLRDNIFLSIMCRSQLESLLTKHVAPLATGFETLRVGVFICGPAGFTKDALDGCDAFEKDWGGIQVTVEVESFDA
ncbi:hypothetical protein BC830DRAFT_1105108 [Chytriomyces sp. MP71]|nr:hypothetical protein BC830DRAFT_1105108 [Chytriomyces sp. MP71]